MTRRAARSRLNIAPSKLCDDERDFILLSKGHAVHALYGVLAELGYSFASVEINERDENADAQTKGPLGMCCAAIAVLDVRNIAHVCSQCDGVTRFAEKRA
jgi:hypothetical protein